MTPLEEVEAELGGGGERRDVLDAGGDEGDLAGPALPDQLRHDLFSKTLNDAMEVLAGQGSYA